MLEIMSKKTQIPEWLKDVPRRTGPYTCLKMELPLRWYDSFYILRSNWILIMKSKCNEKLFNTVTDGLISLEPLWIITSNNGIACWCINALSIVRKLNSCNHWKMHLRFYADRIQSKWTIQNENRMFKFQNNLKFWQVWCTSMRQWKCGSFKNLRSNRNRTSSFPLHHNWVFHMTKYRILCENSIMGIEYKESWRHKFGHILWNHTQILLLILADSNRINKLYLLFCSMVLP